MSIFITRARNLLGNSNFGLHKLYRNINKYDLKKAVNLYRRAMEHKYPDPLKPPEVVRGMVELDRNLFNKEIEVPTLELSTDIVRNVLPNLKKYYLKLSHFKSMRDKDDMAKTKYVILDPRFIGKWEDFTESDRKAFESNGVTNDSFKIEPLTLKYENFTVDELLKSILPQDQDGVAGFSQIGHVVHLNLKDHNLKYKSIIGRVILDKIPNCRTVVNKLDQINHTYRNFEMEVLCGDSDMKVTVKENHCLFEFDFSKVYFNPRLGTEHKRLVDKLSPGDVLYDVFAGVGPFAIPAAKKKCYVTANDLNPDSVEWLRHNAKKNKVNESFLRIHEMDGRIFIRTVVKEDMIKQMRERKTVHVAMNLPAIAYEFLDAFHNLYSADDIKDISPSEFPVVHVYCFAKGEEKEDIALDLVQSGLRYPIKNILEELYFVRTVSNFKHMMRVSFRLTFDILTGANQDDVLPPTKKLRTEIVETKAI